MTFIVIPEYVARHWWEQILFNQSAKRLRAALLGPPHTVVVNVPYRRDDIVTHEPEGPSAPEHPPAPDHPFDDEDLSAPG